MSYDGENLMVMDPYWNPPYKTICTCCMCEASIYEGDTYYEVGGDAVCESCIDDYVKENFRRIG